MSQILQTIIAMRLRDAFVDPIGEAKTAHISNDALERLTSRMPVVVQR